jgi:outer membrane protein
MNKMRIILALLLFGGMAVQAQRFAYVNTDLILERIEDYTKAQEEINKITEVWRQEITTRRTGIEAMYRDFQNDRVLLTKEQEEIRIQEIERKETELRDFQQQKFGFEGELFQKRQELVKPIQDRIYNAIQEYAQDRGYDFIFDQANSTTLLYVNPEQNKTEDVLKRLGITNQ